MFSRSRVILKKYFDNETKYLNQNITIYGWIESMRTQGQSFAFIKLNDGSCVDSIQIIVETSKDITIKDSASSPSMYENIYISQNSDVFDNIFKRGTKGVSLKVEGKIVESPKSNQKTEMVATSIKVLGDVDGKEYPISKGKLPFEHLRKFPHLRVRTKKIAAMQRIRNACSNATHNFFQSHGFSYVNTPIISSNDCEGAGEVFDINPTHSEKIFKSQVSLTVSGQLHGETYACGMGDIYTFGPTFRAEDSHTSRHLSEFWMIEPELCFINLNDLMNLAEDYIKYCIHCCLDECYNDINIFNESNNKKTISIKLNKLNKSKSQENNINDSGSGYDYFENRTDLLKKYLVPFERISYTDAIDLLLNEIEEGRAIIRDNTIENKKFKKKAKGKHVFENSIYWGVDMASEHEKYLTDKIFNKPVIVYNYPKSIKSFYMKQNTEPEEDKRTVQAMDILVPGIGELVGGSMREDNYEVLKDIMDTKGIDISWYLDLRKYGSVPHGGFGLGFERLILLVTGLSNIRDTIPYPRAPEQCLC